MSAQSTAVGLPVKRPIFDRMHVTLRVSRFTFHVSLWVLAVGALTVVGFLLRRYHLGTESFWFDEADIVSRARQPLSSLLGGFTQAGENGPLYTLLLHSWVGLLDAFPALDRVLRVVFGSTYEAPVRALSALFGTASIPLIYALARRVPYPNGRATGNVWLGVTSAALLTFNPFDIWYSQDAKMYSMLVCTTLASTLLYIAALERGTFALWAGYVVATWVMLTTHSMAVLVLLAQLMATPFMLRRKKEVSVPADNSPASDLTQNSTLNTQNSFPWVTWGWAMLLIIGPLFPVVWLRAAALITGTADVGGWYAPAGLWDIIGTTSVTFALNRAPQPWEPIGASLLALLALLGIGYWVLGVGRRSPSANTQYLIPIDARPLLPALWLLPIAGLWLVTLKVPLFQARYLIMALPAYLILVAAGLLFLWRLHPLAMGIAAALIGVVTVIALAGVNYSSQAQKEDWRGAMVYVQDHARLRDAIVVFPGYLETAVSLYYKPGGPGQVPDIPIETIPSLLTQGFGQRELQDTLRAAVKCHERVWLITSPPRQAQEDPNNTVLQWFQYDYHTFDTQVFNGVTVYGINFNGMPDCWYPAPDYSEAHEFENGIGLVGYTYEIRNDAPAQRDASYFPLTLYWRTGDKEPDKDYMVRVQIKNASGHAIKDEALAPLNGYWPTTQWPRNSWIIDYRDLRLPGGLTPGDYTVTVQLYPAGHPDQPVRLQGDVTELVLKQPLKIVPFPR